MRLNDPAGPSHRQGPLMIRARGRWRSVLLFPAVAAVIIIISLPATAAMLRDIRIGEYDAITRIVLEFDSKPDLITPPKIENGILTINLASTTPKLVRRIPLENTKRIRNLEIISHKDDKLEIRIILDSRHSNLKWYNLKDPFRLGIDAEPVNMSTAALPPGHLPESDKQPQNPSPTANESQNHPLQAPKSAGTKQGFSDLIPGQDPESSRQNHLGPENPAGRIRETDAVADVEKTLSTESIPEEGISSAVGHEKSAAPKMPVLVTRTSSGRPTLNGKMDLQLYLVVGLVLLTIIILGLLASIIFSRSKSGAKEMRMTIDELLRNQDEKIKLINAQIDEEMQKFDKI